MEKRNLAVLNFIILFCLIGCGSKTNTVSYQEYAVVRNDIQKVVQANGVVEPRNRVQILPPVGGRIEKILKDEGQLVYSGQPLAYMSSTDRAALIDAARNKSQKDLEYWQKIYKPIPILSPVKGKVILRNVVPGQTISPASVLFELSDELVADAYVDETDMAKISIGQKAVITVNAYPNMPIQGKVVRIKQSSQLVNNVNVYPVQVELVHPPLFLRSGMVANLQFLISKKEKALSLPVNVLQGKENSEVWVLVKNDNPDQKNEKVNVTTGLMDENNIEVLSGLKEGQIVLVPQSHLSGPKTNSGPLSFTPRRNVTGGNRR